MTRSQQMQTQTEGPGRDGRIGNAGSIPVLSATKVRRGFSLVELLVVIAIIGILISLLAVAIGPVLRRVHEGAVTAETGQLELAVESFKNKYGFYPPSFDGVNGIGAGTGATGPTDLVPFLNKISPNHGELGRDAWIQSNCLSSDLLVESHW